MLTLSPLFTSHAVFAEGKPIRVFGTGEGTVTVRFLDKTAVATAEDGRWLVTLPPMVAGGPYEMTVDLDGVTQVLSDVYVGKVYLFAGQSNMAFSLAESNAPEALRKGNERLRLFYASRTQDSAKAYTPWRMADRASIEGFSAVGYLTSADLLDKEEGTVLGAVACAKGASMIEAWLPKGTSEALGIHLRTEEKSPNFTVPPYSTWNGEGFLYEKDFIDLCPFSFTAVVWYQGESQTASLAAACANEAQLTELIRRWRADLRDDALPFVIVQIADYDKEMSDAWRRVQQTQAAVGEAVPGATTVVSRDLCETDNIHPPTKHLLAIRIADALRQFEIK